MIKHLFHEEIGRSYGASHKTIIDTTEIEDGVFETMALSDATGDELDCKRSINAEFAERDFREMVQKYALPLQAAFYRAALVPGERYTLVYLGEFGFPVDIRMTFHSAKLDTYAQYDDVVNLVFTPYRKRQARRLFLYNRSFLIYAGWREMDKEMTFNVERSNGLVTMASKYGSFDEQYIEDIKEKWPDYIVAYDHDRVHHRGDKPKDEPEHDEPRKPFQLLPGLTVAFDPEDGPVLDMDAEDFAALFSMDASENESQAERLERALKRAAVASISHIDDDDGGTCNFDSPAIDFAACGMTKETAKAAIEGAGLHCYDWKPFKNHRGNDGKIVKTPTYLVITGFQSGQGCRRTYMAEAFCDSMNNQGYNTRMYYQMD